MRLKAFFVGWFGESFLAIDQAINAIVMPLVTWSVGMSDETLSARAWRSRNHRWAKALRPAIDFLFSWQKPDPTVADENGPVQGHCQRAYLREKLRRGLPPEYAD
jgi:hypothetical protein